MSDLLAAAGVGAVAGALASGVVVMFLKSYLGAYLSRKGENLATKEDVESLTKLVEDVKHPYSLELEDLRAKHQLRMAAADRRVQAHQEAFVLWRQMVRAMHSESVGKATAECEHWWERNCLYLEPEAHTAFSWAFSCAHLHASYLGDRSPQGADLIKKNWRDILKAGDVLLEAVRLPPLTETEQKVDGQPANTG